MSKLFWSAGLVLTGAIVLGPLLWRSGVVSLDREEEEGLLETDAEIRRAFLSAHTSEASSADTLAAQQQQQQSDTTTTDALVAYDESRQAYNWQRRLNGPRLRSTEFPANLSVLQNLFQKKEFLWTSVNDEQYHFGVALLQFHYVGVVVVNFYDVKTKHSWKGKIEIPFAEWMGVGPQFTTIRRNKTSISSSSSSASAVPEYRAAFVHQSLGAEVELTYSETELCIQLRRCRVTHTQSNEPWLLDVDVVLAVPSHPMQMVFPIGRRRASVVTKFAGAPLAPLPGKDGNEHSARRRGFRLVPSSSSSSSSDSSWIALDEAALGAIDFTRGLLRRTTVWYWACVSGIAHRLHHHGGDGADDLDASSPSSPPPAQQQQLAFGMHLSALTYDDARNVSMESVVYFGSSAFFVNKEVLFERLHDEGTDVTAVQQLSWRIQTNHGDVRRGTSSTADHDVAIDVKFTPADLHDGRFNYVVVYGALMHYWGTFSGRVTVDGEVYEIRGLPGVMEDHFAVW